MSFVAGLRQSRVTAEARDYDLILLELPLQLTPVAGPP
jgi:hypothetical protein